MENLFEKMGEILKPENPETLPLKIELDEVLKKIENIERRQSGGYSSQVSKSFYLGMVGGSGRNTNKLNEKRERELDKTIERAVILCDLYEKRNRLKTKIEYIESGQRDKDEKKKADSLVLLAEYWRNLKAGDYIDIGNGKTLITKKNNKSLETGTGCKWSAAEIIGKNAAKLL